MYRHIRELREEHSLTQTYLAGVIGVSQQTYSDYERGRLDLPTATLKRLAAFYGVSVDFLIEDEGEGSPEHSKVRPLPVSYKSLFSDFKKLSQKDRLKLAENINNYLETV